MVDSLPTTAGIACRFFLAHIWLIPLFPLAGASLMFLFGPQAAEGRGQRDLRGQRGRFVCLCLWRDPGMMARPANQRVVQVILFDWVPAGAHAHCSPGALGHFDAHWGILLDPLSAVMFCVVTGVGLLIHVYSTGYMAHEGGYYRFFGYLNLFMFSMLMLVLANNLLLLFVGWEGVGLCSYLLIGFYFQENRRRTRVRKRSSSIASATPDSPGAFSDFCGTSAPFASPR